MELGSNLIYDLFDSPLGPLWMVSAPEGLSFLQWGGAEPGLIRKVRARTGLAPRRDPSSLALWRRTLERYFSGEKISFDAPISLLVGTPFQQKVWKEMSKIPYGEIRSYRWIAERLGAGRAGRAVGNACGRNPLPIVIPCHRVVRQDGSLGGYTGGIGLKRRLLEIEGAGR